MCLKEKLLICVQDKMGGSQDSPIGQRGVPIDICAIDPSKW